MEFIAKSRMSDHRRGEQVMEPIGAALKRHIEDLLDDVVELVVTLPEGERKTELSHRAHVLEELLMAESPL